MNAPHPLQPQITVATPPVQDDDYEIDLSEYWDILVDARWLVATITLVALLAGGAYALFSPPVYESNLLIQVEDSAGSAKNFLGEAASLFDVKTPATAEMEIIRSRMIIGQAVDNTLLYIDAQPRYLPLIGSWLARHSKNLSDPGFLGLGGFVTGAERIKLSAFTVPQSLEGSDFLLTAKGNGRYVLSHPDLDDIAGAVGETVTRVTPLGPITLSVTELSGKPGAEFELIRRSRLRTIKNLQTNLNLAEKGRQSGVIEATLQSPERLRLTLILNEIGHQYVRQNIERKAAEAQKTLAFLDVQLPQFKKQLDESEEAYNQYRNKQGTVALDEEAKLVLTSSVDLQSKLLDAQQRRRDLVSRFTAEHPSVKTLDSQIAAWNQEIASLNSKVRGMPTVQQDALRLQRDVKVNNELYQQLRNNSLQLQLVREGKIGNVRLIDEAALPEVPVKPQQAQVLGLAAIAGLLAGVILALARNALFRGVRNPQEIEAHTGLNVYSTIPLSGMQRDLARKSLDRLPGVHVLAAVSPHEPAIESLRSLRTALQFAMLEAPNNRVLVTGATPGVGKSFISVNFAALLASAGKRVLLIDADLRKGYLNHYFGLERTRGLSEVVAGTLKISDAIRRDVLPNLDLLTTGVMPPNPAELMMSTAFSKMLESVSTQYDLVIMDTPPVLVAADTVSVAPQVGTLLLVARAEQTQIGDLHESAKRLAHAGRTVSGVLFNAMDMSRRHSGSYGYKYGRYKYRNYSYQAGAARQ